MLLRTILIYSFAASATCAAATRASAQDAPEKRLASIVAVAIAEYRLGVDSAGRVVSDLELGEAREFLADARTIAARVDGARSGELRALVDSLAAAVGRTAALAITDSLYRELTDVLGPAAALDLPSRHVDPDAGRAIYARSCASCHGAAGLGDGPDSKRHDPVPAPLAGDAARDVAAGLMFRVITVGIKGTAMAGWESSLSVDDRWDVIAYINTLRLKAGNTAMGDIASAPTRDFRAVEATVMRDLDEAVALARAGRTSPASERAFDAYVAFEPVEALVRARVPARVAAIEGDFLAVRSALRAGDVPAADSAVARIRAELPSIIALAEPAASRSASFLQSLVIILREGFEAILIIGAIVAMLMRTGNSARVRDVWAGAGLALVASGITAVVLQTTLRALPATREVIEGVTMLVAVVVLFSVSYWILSKVESDKWQAYIRERVNTAIAGGARATLVGVAFLVVYREGAETALFYQALAQANPSSLAPISAGFGVGCVLLAVIYFAFHRFGVRIPLRPFFATTGALLYLMAFVFMGKGLRELQEGGALSATPLEGIPMIHALGVYPTVETVAGQWVMAGLFLLALWRTLVTPRLSARSRKSRGAQVPLSGAPTSTLPQPPQTPAR